MEEERLRERRPQPRKAAQRELKFAVLADDPRSCDPHPRFAQYGCEAPNVVGPDPGVGIEEQHRGCRAPLPTEIAAGRETPVRVGGYSLERQIAHLREAVIRRRVVHDYDVQTWLACERRDAGVQRSSAVVRDHDDIDHVVPLSGHLIHYRSSVQQR